MGRMCYRSHSLYNGKECDDCGRCLADRDEPVEIEESDILSFHKFNCSLSAPIDPAVLEHLERIRARND